MHTVMRQVGERAPVAVTRAEAGADFSRARLEWPWPHAPSSTHAGPAGPRSFAARRHISSPALAGAGFPRARHLTRRVVGCPPAWQRRRRRHSTTPRACRGTGPRHRRIRSHDRAPSRRAREGARPSSRAARDANSTSAPSTSRRCFETCLMTSTRNWSGRTHRGWASCAGSFTTRMSTGSSHPRDSRRRPRRRRRQATQRGQGLVRAHLLTQPTLRMALGTNPRTAWTSSA